MIVRALLVLACSVSGYFIAFYLAAPTSYDYLKASVGFIIGLVVALLVIMVEKDIRKLSLRVIAGGVVGIVIGLVIAVLLAFGLNMVVRIQENQQFVPWIYLLLTGILGYKSREQIGRAHV